MTDNLSFSRKRFLQYGITALGTTIAAKSLTANLANAESINSEPDISKQDLTTDEALDLLIEGNQRFINDQRQNSNQNVQSITAVASEQFPFASILTCADSRVPVEIIFDQGFGDLFVVRDAGNVATAEEIGSLEFGSAVLSSKVILVLGHEECGAVKAAVAGKPVPGSIGSILEAIQPAVQEGDKTDENYLPETVKRNVLLQIEALKTSPVLSQLIDENQLKIVGGYYDLDTALVEIIT